MSVARFIADQRTNYRVPHTLSCAVLGVSVSWVHKWLDRPPTDRQRRRGELDNRVRERYEASGRTYGSPRVHADLIAEGVALITVTLPRGPVGPYQVQAAIAAVHDEAPTSADTDWPQVVALYGVLERIAPHPLVTLNRAVAVAEVEGPEAGLALLSTLDGDRRMARNHRLLAVRADRIARAARRAA